MSRRQLEKTDSLEMLLDTMCNAFGGIILIAILIAILAKPPTPEGGDPEVEIVKVQIEALTPEDEDLQDEKMDKTKLAVAIDPAVTNLVQQRLDLTIKITASTNTLANLAQTPEEKKKIEQKINDQQRANIDTATELAQNERVRQQIQDQMQQAFKGKPVTVRAPQVRGTKKGPTFLIIQHGKFWAADIFIGGKRKDNEFSCKIERDSSGRALKQVPVLSRGVRIIKNEAQLAGTPIGQYIKQFPPQTHFCICVVHKNSFSEFRILKELLIKRGIDYTWMPSTENNISLRFGGGNSLGPQ
jgi:hypothetical protein